MFPPLQIFTNSDEAHAATVLEKMGLEGCFEGIICFETLNPKNPGDTDASSGKRVLCKPSLESMEAVVEIAKLDPKKTVSSSAMDSLVASPHRRTAKLQLQWPSLSLAAVTDETAFDLQVFFDDSPRNIASGKAAGFHTVIVSSHSPCVNPHTTGVHVRN